MKKIVKLILLSISSGLIMLLAAQSAFALSVVPAKIANTLDPGESYSIDLNVGSEINQTLKFEVVDYYYNESGGKEFLTDGSSLATGLKDWITIGNTEMVAGPNTASTNLVTIKVPEDAKGGAYFSAILVEPLSTDDEGQVSIATRLAVIVAINVGGEEATEELEIVSFDFDKDMAARGNYQFKITFKNTGTSYVSPIGTIKIFDKNGNQIKNIQKISSEIEGEEVVSGFNDEINVNATSSSVYPGREETFTAVWPSPNIVDGTYNAKLELFYGRDSKKMEAEKEFTVKKGLNVAEFITNDYKNSPPVLFSGKIENAGGLPISMAAEIRVTNSFGQIVEILPVTDGTEKIDAGATYDFSDVEWAKTGFAGLYSATLFVNQGKGNILAEETINLFIIVWWQIILAIVVLALIIFGVVKYVQLAKKAKSAEKKE